MDRHTDYFYKGYDINNKNRVEKLAMEYFNEYGYNLESTSRRVVNEELKATRTNKDYVKNKEFNIKG